MGAEVDGEGKQEGGRQWEGGILTRLKGDWVVGQTAKVDRKDRGGGGDFTNGMSRWRYFSRAKSGQPASD